MLDTVVVGGQVVADGSVAEATVGIEGERIAAIVDPGVPLAAARTIDARGKLVLPGVVEPHFHYTTGLRFQYSRGHVIEQVDDVETGSRAAAYGGVTTIFPFWWPPQPTDPMPDVMAQLIADGNRRSYVDFAPHCCLWPNLDRVAEIPAVLEMGITSFKAFMIKRGNGRMTDGYTLAKEMEQIRHGGILLVHSEDGDLLEVLEERLIAEGKVGAEYYWPSRPNVTERIAVERVIATSAATDCPVYIVHLSTREGLAAIAAAKLRGQPVFTETCPQYLLLTDELTRRQPTRAKISPPLRSPEDQAAMWGGIRQGVIDCVGSDHTPFALADKERAFAEGNIFDTPTGMPGIETMLPLLYSEGVRPGRISLPRLVEVLCEGPARVFGLYPQKGTIKVGSDADIVIVDPALEWTVRDEDLHNTARWSAFVGWRVVGKPVLSLLRGRLLLEGERLAAAPGCGQFLPRRRWTR
ncbi:MAG: amidohydrolase family protein [Chloroflexi bacterium]|nr:amidohydrolase family protein [Chloroflexota bacterium]